MKFIITLLLLSGLLLVGIYCTDAYNNPNCQYTLILSIINTRSDSIRTELIYTVNDTIEPGGDFVYVGTYNYQGREVCLRPNELVFIQNSYVKSISTFAFDSLIQTDTIDPWETSYSIGETNVLEEIELFIR